MTSEIIIYFQGLLFLFLFHIIGHPIINVVLQKPTTPHKLANLDFIQRLPLEFVTGGAVIYVVALVTTPFHGFTPLVCWFVTGVAAFFYLYQHLQRIASFIKPSKFSWLAFAGFFLALAIRVGPISNFVLGSNQDISWHTLITYSIIRTGGVPSSVIEGFILQVPVGVHTNLAFFSMITEIPPEFITFNSLVFLSTIIGLAAYFFGSIISSQKFGLYVSLIMITLSYYPSAITWGSDWLLLGLLLFFVAAALIVSFDAESLPLCRSNLLIVLLTGAITGFLASTYIPLYIILLLVLIFFVLLGRKDVVSKLKRLAAVFALGVPLFATWIYRFFFLSQPMTSYLAKQATDMMYNQAFERSAVFLPIRDFSSPSIIMKTLTNWLTWDYQSGWAGAYFFFPLLVIGCILLLNYLINHRIKGFDHLMPRYAVSIFLMVILWGLNGPFGLFYETGFGLDIMTSELDKIAPIIGTILLPFIAAFGLITVQKFISKRTKVRSWVSALVILLVILSSIAVAPFTKAWLVGSYQVFASATESDYELLEWMRTGIPQNSTVLIHPYDAGQYVPSISGQKTVGIASTGVIFINQWYEDLNYHIRNNVFNSVTISLFRGLGIDYIFVGGQAFKERWDSEYFIRNPLYFTIVRNIDLSYLFAVKIPDISIGAGLVNNTDYTGVSNNETLLDLQHMTLYNLDTGEGVYLEVGLRDNSSNTLEYMNYWNPPKSVTISEEANQTANFSFTLAGSQFSLNCNVSSNNVPNITIDFSSGNAPQQSSIYFSLFPIYEVQQNGVHFTTDQIDYFLLSSNSSVQGTRQNGVAYFQITPHGKQVVTSSLYYLSVSSGVSLDINLRTGQIK